MASPQSTPRNFLSRFRLLSAPGSATIFAAVVLWLGGYAAGRAQFSFGDSSLPPVPPVVRPPMEEPWPEVEWGMQPMAGGMGENRGRPAQSFTDDAPPLVLSLDSARGNVVMHFRAQEDDGLGPVVSIDALPAPGGETNHPKALTPEPGALRLGNVSFNQAADSFNVGKPESGKADDLSRQFGGTGIASKSVVAATPINGWAIAGIAALTVVAALAIGFFENDRDDRERRKKNRRRKHRHSS